MEAFQLRLWDGRLVRLLSPDPYHQFHSPYVGMGNNPIGFVDHNGGNCYIVSGNEIPCPDGFGQFTVPTNGHMTILPEVLISNSPIYT